MDIFLSPVEKYVGERWSEGREASKKREACRRLSHAETEKTKTRKKKAVRTRQASHFCHSERGIILWPYENLGLLLFCLNPLYRENNDTAPPPPPPALLNMIHNNFMQLSVMAAKPAILVEKRRGGLGKFYLRPPAGPFYGLLIEKECLFCVPIFIRSALKK